MSATMLYDPGQAKPARLFVWDCTRTMQTVDVQSGMVLGRACPGREADLPLARRSVSPRHGVILQLEDGDC